MKCIADETVLDRRQVRAGGRGRERHRAHQRAARAAHVPPRDAAAGAGQPVPGDSCIVCCVVFTADTNVPHSRLPSKTDYLAYARQFSIRRRTGYKSLTS